MSISTLNQDVLKRKFTANEQDLPQQSGPNQKMPKFSEPFEPLIDKNILENAADNNNNAENIENNYNNNEKAHDIDDFKLDYEDEGDGDDDDDDDEIEQILNTTQQLQSQKEQSHTTPQRKKPGRKPNPASPAVRKAQNRAAQRAFRERKERHLRDLENTIKNLRDNQYQANIKYQYEYQRLNDLINHLQRENSHFKRLSMLFEYALNNLHGNNIATDEIKKKFRLTNTNYSVDKTTTTATTPDEPLSSSLLSSDIVSLLNINDITDRNSEMISRHDQIIESNDDSDGDGGNDDYISSITNTSPDPLENLSSTSVSGKNSPNTPVNKSSQSFIENSQLINVTPTIITNPLFPQDHSTTIITDTNMVTSNHKSSFINIPLQINNIEEIFDGNSISNNNSNGTIGSIFDLPDDFICSNNDNVGLSLFNFEFSLNDFNNESSSINAFINNNSKEREKRQYLRLAEKVGAKDLMPIIPKLNYLLSEEQVRYLKMEHDSRIDMIPCLHLRSRMIQYRDKYDLYELCEILINKTICHGDPLDNISWILPDEIFKNYSYLTFKRCQIKSLLYKRDGSIPKNFTALFENGDYRMLIS